MPELPLLPGVQTSTFRSGRVRNHSVASQAPVAATRTYITGSQLQVPEGGLKVGAVIRFKLNMTKTAAGTAASTFDICFGAAGTTADTAQVSFTKPAGTAAVDEATVEVEAVVRSVSATGVVVGQFRMTHNLAATGHAQIPSVDVNTVSAAFDNTAGGLYIGLCLTSGAADAITIQQVTASIEGV